MYPKCHRKLPQTCQNLIYESQSTIYWAKQGTSKASGLSTCSPWTSFILVSLYTSFRHTHTKKQKQTHINHMKLLQYVPGPVKSPHKILLSNVLPRVLSWFIYRPGQRETHRQASKVFCKSSETSLKYLPTGP